MNKEVENKFIVDFGNHLRKVRNEKKISMEKLADLCEIEYSQIARIERGLIATSLRMVKRIASALEIEVKDLFEF